MAGTFRLGLVGFILLGASTVSGSVTEDAGNLSLRADFANGTLTGGGTGADNPVNILLNGNSLSVNGKF